MRYNMEFIGAKESDFPIIYNMMVKAREKADQEGIHQWNENYPTKEMIMRDILGEDTYLVYEEGNVKGFFITNSVCEDDVHGHIKWMYPQSRFLILHRLCVDPSIQDQGIGQRILRKYEERAVEAGYESVRIDVFGTNNRAIHIYEKFGYKRMGRAVCDRGEFFIYEKHL